MNLSVIVNVSSIAVLPVEPSERSNHSTLSTFGPFPLIQRAIFLEPLLLI